MATSPLHLTLMAAVMARINDCGNDDAVRRPPKQQFGIETLPDI